MKLNAKLKQHSLVEILLLLLFTDFLVILAHIALRIFPGENPYYWQITSEQGFGETFQYLKELWLFCSFAALIWIRAEWSYLSLSLLFAYLFADDGFAIHESLGEWWAGALNFQPALGLRARDFGELMVSAIAGGSLLVLIGCSYWLGSQKFRAVCKRIAVLVGCLAFFGIGVDMVHIMIERANLSLPGLKGILELIEDGGEMLVMSVMCWYGISLLRQKDPVAQSSPTLDQQELSTIRR